MDYVRATLPWLPLIIATIYSVIMGFVLPNEKMSMFFGLVSIFLVWICTRKWGGNSSSNLNLVEANKQLMTENEGLRDNLVKVYNMVQAQSRGASKPVAHPPPNVSATVSPPVPNIQNQSVAGTGSPEESDGRPYL